MAMPDYLIGYGIARMRRDCGNRELAVFVFLESG